MKRNALSFKISALKSMLTAALLFTSEGSLDWKQRLETDASRRLGAFGRKAVHALWPVSVLPGGLKCPVCSFVYGTKWEFNRHLKNKHGLKLVESEGDPKWEVHLKAWSSLWVCSAQTTNQASPVPFLGAVGFLVGNWDIFSNPVSHLMGVYWVRSGPRVWLLTLSCV